MFEDLDVLPSDDDLDFLPDEPLWDFVWEGHED